MLSGVAVIAPRLTVMLTDSGWIYRGAAAGTPQTAPMPFASKGDDLLRRVHSLLAALAPVFEIWFAANLARRRVRSPHDTVIRELGAC